MPSYLVTLMTEPERGVNASLLCSSAIFLSLALASSRGMSVDGRTECCLGLFRRDMFRDPGIDVGAEGARARILPGRVPGALGSLTLVGLLPANLVLLESSLWRSGSNELARELRYAGSSPLSM